MATTAKTLRFAAELDGEGRISAEGGEPLALLDGWQAEHLLLAGLARCSLTSLRYHAGRAEIDVAAARGSARGKVTKRAADERYAFVEIECDLEIELDPAPPGAELRELLAKAERDCFVGASLTASPRYRWTVNGDHARPSS